MWVLWFDIWQSKWLLTYGAPYNIEIVVPMGVLEFADYDSGGFWFVLWQLTNVKMTFKFKRKQYDSKFTTL